jgi:hypothetical protein
MGAAVERALMKKPVAVGVPEFFGFARTTQLLKKATQCRVKLVVERLIAGSRCQIPFEQREGCIQKERAGKRDPWRLIGKTSTRGSLDRWRAFTRGRSAASSGPYAQLRHFNRGPYAYLQPSRQKREVMIGGSPEGQKIPLAIRSGRELPAASIHPPRATCCYAPSTSQTGRRALGSAAVHGSRWHDASLYGVIS